MKSAFDAKVAVDFNAKVIDDDQKLTYDFRTMIKSNFHNEISCYCISLKQISVLPVSVRP